MWHSFVMLLWYMFYLMKFLSRATGVLQTLFRRSMFFLPAESEPWKGWPNLGGLCSSCCRVRALKRLTQFRWSWSFPGASLWNFIMARLRGEFFLLISPLAGLYASQAWFIWNITILLHFQSKQYHKERSIIFNHFNGNWLLFCLLLLTRPLRSFILYSFSY